MSARGWGAATSLWEKNGGRGGGRCVLSSLGAGAQSRHIKEGGWQNRKEAEEGYVEIQKTWRNRAAGGAAKGIPLVAN